MNLQNLVDYCEEFDLPGIFSGATVPEPLNIDTCISAIMVRCGLLTPVYNDPDTFRDVTTLWFTRKQWTFEHLIEVIKAKYSPIENVDEVREEITTYDSKDTHTGGYTDTGSGSDNVEESGTDERDISNSGTDTTTNTVSAFNSSGYQADNKSETEHGHTVDDDITYGKNTETTYGKTIEHTYNDDTIAKTGIDKFEVKRHGNIGVTSNVKLIEEELSLLRHFDIYGYIAELFEAENMLLIY